MTFSRCSYAFRSPVVTYDPALNTASNAEAIAVLRAWEMENDIIQDADPFVPSHHIDNLDEEMAPFSISRLPVPDRSESSSALDWITCRGKQLQSSFRMKNQERLQTTAGYLLARSQVLATI